jgi:AcrR family transcriptional regulator
LTRGEKTYEKILQAGLDLVSRHGYAGTSIKDITDTVGLTKAAFYAHFGSKGELLNRLIEEYETKYIDEKIKTVNEHPGNAIDKLHRAISFSSEFGVKQPELVILFHSLCDELKADIVFEPVLTRIRRRHETFLTELYDLGKRQGLVKKNLDSNLLAILQMAFSQGMYQQWIQNQSRIDGMKYMRNFRVIFFKGIEAEYKKGDANE